jgi:FixJ family two-component response regulator
LAELISGEGWDTETFASAQEFLSSPRLHAPSCLVLDVGLAGVSGLDLQKRLSNDGVSIPIIFMADFSDVPTTVRAMKAGALEFLMKPFGHEELFSAIRQAIERSQSMLGHEAKLRDLRDRHLSLSRREQEVMALVAAGLLNKQVGHELGISEITVKAHRGKVMRKMKANSLVDLVMMAARLQIAPAFKDRNGSISPS